MPWSGGNYTKNNASTGGWTGDAAGGIGIEAGRHDTQDNDFASGIDACLAKDGSNSCTGDLNLGGYKPVNVATGTAGAPSFCAGGDVNTGMYSGGADTIAWATNGVLRMLLNSIGQLAVSDGAAATPGITFTGDTDTGAFRPTANTFAIVTGGSERLRVDSSGRLGLGTTSPASAVDVQGISDGSSKLATTRFSNDATPVTLTLSKSRGATVGANTIVVDGDSVGQINFEAANGTSYNSLAAILAAVDGVPGASADMPGRLVFRTAPDGSATTLERMRISQNGIIGVNDTVGTSYQLRVRTSASAITGAARLATDYSGDVGNPVLLVEKYDATNTTSQIFVRFNIGLGSAPAGSGQITANGANQAAFGSYSDRRMKENITPLGDELSNILALNPVEFDYINGAGHQLGFIAQEVQEIYPDLVSSDENGNLLLADLNKNDARLIKAFQQLAAKVEALEAKLAEPKP